MAVQQHELRDRRSHYREGRSHTATSILAGESIHAPGNDERERYRSGKTWRHRSSRLLALRSGTAAPGAEGRQGMALCGWRVSDAGAGPGEVGHFDHGSKVDEAIFLSRVQHRSLTQEWIG